MSSKTKTLENENFVFNFIKDHSNDAYFVSKLKNLVDSLKSDDDIDLPLWQKTELKKRLESYKNNPNDVIDWKVAKSQLLSR